MATTQFITFAAALLIAGCSVSSPGVPDAPDAQKIKEDMLGNAIGDVMLGPRYRFTSMSEFEDVKITTTTRSGNVVEYKVDLRLVGDPGKSHWTANASVVYRLEDQNRWRLVVLESRSLKNVKTASPGG